MFDGIPAYSHITPPEVVETIPGDHLQLNYYFWLAGDMLLGNTRPFYNVYEFNTGSDAGRFQPEPYYLPFSLINLYASIIGGRAFGWNVTGFISIWLTYLLTWMLTRRYTSNDWIAAAGAVIAVTIPFRWVNLFGGSPAGFAMMWLPMIWLGIDLAIRENRRAGGYIAGIAVLLACWTDSHVFFFSVLSIPAWIIFALFKREYFEWDRQNTYRILIRALIPLIVLTGLALLCNPFQNWIAMLVTGDEIRTAVSSRSMREVSIFSPVWQGLFSWHDTGCAYQLYLGYAAPAVIAAGMLILAVKSRANTGSKRDLLLLALTLAGMILIILLALGARGPYDGIVIRIFRKLIKPYCLVRQSAKVFCLMPTLLAVAAAISLNAVFTAVSSIRIRITALVIISILITVEYADRTYPTISVLDRTQEAYGAAATDASESRRQARILALPLWPGDSHFSSLYEYYASLYRIRMINGYSPFVKPAYINRIFSGLESVNEGLMSPTQIADLQRMGVTHILLHEDAFPEKVSPFPVGFTLRNLMNSPSLKFIKRDRNVWAFRILETPGKATDAGISWRTLSCARSYEAESIHRLGVNLSPQDTSASGYRFVTFRGTNGLIQVRPVEVVRAPELRWMIRLRGDGALVVRTAETNQTWQTGSIDVHSGEWVWKSLPLELRRDLTHIDLALTGCEGQVDVDILLLVAGEWTSPEAGTSITVPAPCFFHSGHTEIARNTVSISKDNEERQVVFYGPNLPLEKGLYKVRFEVNSHSAHGTNLGTVNVHPAYVEPEIRLPVIAGTPCEVTYRQSANLPVSLEFEFSKAADLEIESVSFTRLQ